MAHWSKRAKKNDISYLMEMLKHRYSVYGLLGSLAATTFLSIPFGFGVALLPVLGYTAATSLAALFVPGSKWWRYKVDREKAQEQREAARQRLLSEIQRRAAPDNKYWGVYHRMLQRRDSLRRMATEHESALTHEEVDRLDDATVDFLGLWLGRIAIYERHQSISARDVERRIQAIDQQLGEAESTDKRRLLKAKKDLEELLRRRDEMASRDAAADAAMLSMADTFDEVYQRLMANPTSQENVRVELEQAVERMNIEEELDYVLEEEVDAFLEGGR